MQYGLYDLSEIDFRVDDNIYVILTLAANDLSTAALQECTGSAVLVAVM